MDLPWAGWHCPVMPYLLEADPPSSGHFSECCSGKCPNAYPADPGSCSKQSQGGHPSATPSVRQRHQAKKNDCTVTQAGVFSDPDQGSHSSAQHSNESHICPECRSEQGGQLVGVSQYPPWALPRAAQYLLGGDPGYSPSTAPSVRQRHRATDQSTEEHPEKADFATQEGYTLLE